MRRKSTLVKKDIELQIALREAKTCPFLLFFRRRKIRHYLTALEWVLNNPNVEDLL